MTPSITHDNDSMTTAISRSCCWCWRLLVTPGRASLLMQPLLPMTDICQSLSLYSRHFPSISSKESTTFDVKLHGGSWSSRDFVCFSLSYHLLFTSKISFQGNRIVWPAKMGPGVSYSDDQSDVYYIQAAEIRNSTLRLCMRVPVQWRGEAANRHQHILRELFTVSIRTDFHTLYNNGPMIHAPYHGYWLPVMMPSF